MATAKKAGRSSGRSASAGKGNDAISLLTRDHKEVKDLFKQYEKLVKADADEEQKTEIADQICTMLTVHATIEEEIFYPAAREALDHDELIDEAAVEHATAKDLIAQIESMSPAEDLYDAKVKVLGEYIDHHVTEEQDQIFPKVKKAGMELDAVGERLMARKEELMSQQAASAAGAETAEAQTQAE